MRQPGPRVNPSPGGRPLDPPFTLPFWRDGDPTRETQWVGVVVEQSLVQPLANGVLRCLDILT